MSKKTIAFLCLFSVTTIQPLFTEIIMGALGAAGVKALSSPKAKAMRWVAVGYFLNSPVGKKMSSRGFEKLRQVAASRVRPLQIGSRADFGWSSHRTLAAYRPSRLQVFSNMPKTVEAWKQSWTGLKLREVFAAIVRSKHYSSPTLVTEKMSQAVHVFKRTASYHNTFQYPSKVPVKRHVYNNQLVLAEQKYQYDWGDNQHPGYRAWKAACIGFGAGWLTGACFADVPTEEQKQS